MKNLLLFASMALFCLNVNAQDKQNTENKGLKGAFWATSQIGYSKTSAGDDTMTNFNIIPIVGYFVSPSVTAGVGVGVVNIKNETAGVTNAKTNLLVVEPLVRKYWNVAGKMYFFGQLAAPIINGKESEANMKISQYGVAMSGGFDFFVTKNFSVELSYNLINVSSTTITPDTGSKITVTDVSVAHVATVDSTYNGELGGSLPALTTPLSFGFKFVF